MSIASLLYYALTTTSHIDITTLNSCFLYFFPKEVSRIQIEQILLKLKLKFETRSNRRDVFIKTSNFVHLFVWYTFSSSSSFHNIVLLLYTYTYTIDIWIKINALSCINPSAWFSSVTAAVAAYHTRWVCEYEWKRTPATQQFYRTSKLFNKNKKKKKGKILFLLGNLKCGKWEIDEEKGKV